MAVIEAKRDYIITDTTMAKCDLCKRVFAKLFDLTPSKKTHSFDNIVLCASCLDKCQLQYSKKATRTRSASRKIGLSR